MLNRLFALVVAAAGARRVGPGPPRPHPRRSPAHRQRRRSAALARWLWVAYTVTTIDAEKDRRNTDVWMVKWDGSEQLQLTSSPDSELAALESRQQVPGIRGVARAEEERKRAGRSGCSIAPAAKRSASATSRACPTSSGRQTARASRSLPRIRIRRGAGARGLEAQDRADRDRSLSLQAGSRRLPEAPLQPHRHLHHRHQGGEGDHERQRQRSESFVVARRQADRVPEQARPCRSGSHVK